MVSRRHFRQEAIDGHLEPPTVYHIKDIMRLQDYWGGLHSLAANLIVCVSYFTYLYKNTKYGP